MSYHTPECLARQQKIQQTMADWIKKYPSYCRNCHGWGGKTDYYDPSPAGVSLGSGFMVDFEPCPECIDKGICGRCGSKWDEEDGCITCGWNCNDGLYFYDGCNCDYEQMMKDLESHF